jgi:hypothetical protein
LKSPPVRNKHRSIYRLHKMMLDSSLKLFQLKGGKERREEEERS